MSEQNEGLRTKYIVKRIGDHNGKHKTCGYFVLDPQHDLMARHALKEYAKVARAEGHTALADDLTLWVERLDLDV